MKPKQETHVFQPQPDFRVEAEVTDYGATIVVNIEFSGQLDPRFVEDYLAWIAPIANKCYEKPSTTYYNGTITYTWPLGDGNWARTSLTRRKEGRPRPENPGCPRREGCLETVRSRAQACPRDGWSNEKGAPCASKTPEMLRLRQFQSPSVLKMQQRRKPNDLRSF